MKLHNVTSNEINSLVKPNIIDVLIFENQIWTLVTFEFSGRTDIIIYCAEYISSSNEFILKTFPIQHLVKSKNIKNGMLYKNGSILNCYLRYTHSILISISGPGSTIPKEVRSIISIKNGNITITPATTGNMANLLPQSQLSQNNIINHSFESTNFKLNGSSKFDNLYYFIGTISQSGHLIIPPDLIKTSNTHPFKIVFAVAKFEFRPFIGLLEHKFCNLESPAIVINNDNKDSTIDFKFRKYNFVNDHNINIQFSKHSDFKNLNTCFTKISKKNELKVRIKPNFESGLYYIRLKGINNVYSKTTMLQINNDLRNAEYKKTSIYQFANIIYLNILILLLYLLYLFVFNPELQEYSLNPFKHITNDPTLKEPLYGTLSFVVLYLIARTLSYINETQVKLEDNYFFLWYLPLLPVILLSHYIIKLKLKVISTVKNLSTSSHVTK